MNKGASVPAHQVCSGPSGGESELSTELSSGVTARRAQRACNEQSCKRAEFEISTSVWHSAICKNCGWDRVRNAHIGTRSTKVKALCEYLNIYEN